MPADIAGRFAGFQPFAWGGTGTLYLGLHAESGQMALLKLLSAAQTAEPAERTRHHRELRKQLGIAFPHLPRVLEAGENAGRIWFVREFVSGESLLGRLHARRTLSTPAALAVIAQLASSLDALHRQALVHRDLKPGHVLFRTDMTGAEIVQLIDAGVAAQLPGRGPEARGTAAYTAPEIVEGGQATFRSDLYALGCLACELLTGSQPFARATQELTLAAQRADAPPELDAVIPAAVRTLIASLLSKDPRRRPFSAQQVRRSLEPFLPDTVPAAPALPRSSPPPPPPEALGHAAESGKRSSPPLGALGPAPAASDRPKPSAPPLSVPPAASSGNVAKRSVAAPGKRSTPPPPPPEALGAAAPKRSAPPPAANGGDKPKPSARPVPPDATMELRAEELEPASTHISLAGKVAPAPAPTEELDLDALLQTPQDARAGVKLPSRVPTARPGSLTAPPKPSRKPDPEDSAPTIAIDTGAVSAQASARVDELGEAVRSSSFPPAGPGHAPPRSPNFASTLRSATGAPSQPSAAGGRSAAGTPAAPPSAASRRSVGTPASGSTPPSAAGGSAAGAPAASGSVPPSAAGARPAVGTPTAPPSAAGGRSAAGTAAASGSTPPSAAASGAYVPPSANAPGAGVSGSAPPSAASASTPAPSIRSRKSTELGMGPVRTGAVADKPAPEPDAPARASASLRPSATRTQSGLAPVGPTQVRIPSTLESAEAAADLAAITQAPAPSARSQTLDATERLNLQNAQDHTLRATQRTPLLERPEVLLWGAAAVFLLAVGARAIGGRGPERASDSSVTVQVPTAEPVAALPQPSAADTIPQASPQPDEPQLAAAEPSPDPAPAAPEPPPSAAEPSPAAATDPHPRDETPIGGNSAQPAVPTLSAAQAGKGFLREPGSVGAGGVVPYRARPPLDSDFKAKARQLYQEGKYREAAEAYQKASVRTPSDPAAFAGLGASWLAVGESDRAIAAYQRAVQLKPDVSGFQAALGRAYLAKGDRARALAAYNKALELDPDNQAARSGAAALRQK